MPADQKTPLYLFAKAPVPGRVKTRMQPTLDANTCAALAREMLQQSAALVAKHWPGRRILCVAPTLKHPAFDEVCSQYQFERRVQVGEGLGERMLDALGDGITQHGKAVVMGCDVPYLGGEILAEAWDHLSRNRNVIGPAEDGGFYLMGVDRLPTNAFRDVGWGGGEVLGDVLDRSKEDGLTFHQLPTLRDIDRVEDLTWLGARCPGYQRFLSQGAGPAVHHG